MSKRKSTNIDISRIHKKARVSPLQQVVETNMKIINEIKNVAHRVDKKQESISEKIKDISQKVNQKDYELHEKINKVEKDLEIIKKSLTNLGKSMGIDLLCVWESTENTSEYNYFA